jgi:hypothetical protein
MFWLKRWMSSADEYPIAAPVDDCWPYFLLRLLSEYREPMRGTFTFPKSTRPTW